MFTGIIEEIGEIKGLSHQFGLREIEVKADKVLANLEPKDSIAINGVCLTVTKCQAGCFTVEAIKETLKKTNLGKLKIRDKVNLERAIKPEGRLGGHLVLGHIDGLAKIVKKQKLSQETYFWLKAELELLRQIVTRGSIALEGVSLTVAEIKAGLFKIALIPYTLKQTILGEKKIGDELNLELDYLGKYVQKYLLNLD